MPNVYIVSKSSHDFSDAKRYGRLVFLSRGALNRYNVNNMTRQFQEKLKDSSPSDFILPCGLSMMNSIACAMFALKHKRLNILLFYENRYIERNIVFDDQEETTEDKED